MNEKHDDLERFVRLYMSLTPEKKNQVDLLLAWMFIKQAWEKPSREHISLAWEVSSRLAWPVLWRPVLGVALSLLFVILWFVTLGRLS